MLFLTFITASCQPTPENVVVRNKGNDTLMNMISDADNQKEDFASIGTVAKQIADPNLNVEITIDAEVLIPNVSTIPVHTYEYREFTQDDIDNIVSVLCGGKQLFEINEELTVDDIDDRIIYYKKKLSETTDVDGNSSNGDATPFSPEVISNIIEEYEALRKTAPDEIQLIPASFLLPSDNEGYLLTGQTDAPFYERETISIFSSIATGTQVTYYNPSFLRHSYKEYTDITPNGLTISEQEAIEQAQQLLNDLGETQMQLCSIVADESILQSEASLIDNEDLTSPFYQLTFIRSINDIPSTYEYRYFTNDDNAEMVYYERIYIYVNDNGIVAFEWNSPLIEKKVLNSNVGLMEFDEILQVAINNLPLMVSKDFTGKKDITIVDIDTIRLGYMQVKMKNKRNEFMLIPVWDFFGTSKQHYTEIFPGWTMDEDGWLRQNNLAESYITINAIDGSIINRDLGY